MNDKDAKGVIGTARMRIRLKDVRGKAPCQSDPWGHFTAAVTFDGEEVGVCRHSKEGTSLKADREKEMRDFVSRFPKVPPHNRNLDLETVIRMMAFEKL
jgi:hypothetical protein